MAHSEHSIMAASKATAALTQGGAGLTILGGLALSDVAIIVGIIVSVLGLVGNLAITWYWKRRDFRLHQEQVEWDRRRKQTPVANERRHRDQQ